MSVAPKSGAREQLLDFLSGHKGESGIVYALSRKSTEELAEFARFVVVSGELAASRDLRGNSISALVLSNRRYASVDDRFAALLLSNCIV